MKIYSFKNFFTKNRRRAKVRPIFALQYYTPVFEFVKKKAFAFVFVRKSFL